MIKAPRRAGRSIAGCCVSRSCLLLLACGSRAGCPGRSAGLLSRPRYRRTPRLHQGHRLHRRTASIWSRPPTTRRSASGTGRPARRSARCAASSAPAMTARSLRSRFRPTARRSPPAAISAPGWATSRPMATSACSISPPARSRQPSRRPTTPIYDLAFSPDGSFLAAGGQDGFVYVWQARRGGSDRLESRSPSSTPIPGISSNWPSPMAATGWSPRRPTTASGCGICLPATEIAMPDAEPLRDQPVMALAVSRRRRAVCDRQQ